MEKELEVAENASVESGEQGQEANYEAQARDMGWKPQEQYKGPAEKWVDAKTYIERGEHILPIVQAKLRKTEKELQDVRKSAQEWQEFTKAAKEREVAEWRAKFEQAVKDKAEAISKGDGEAAVEAEARQEELKATRPEPKQEVKVDPLALAWKEANDDWFDKDEDKTTMAMAIAMKLQRKGVIGEAFFQELDKELERRTAPTPRAGPQRGGKPSGGGGKGARTYENLTSDFKEVCDRQVRTLGIKKEEYVAACPDDAFRS